MGAWWLQNLSTCSSSVALMWINPFRKKESCRFLKILLMVNLNCVNLLKVTYYFVAVQTEVVFPPYEAIKFHFH